MDERSRTAFLALIIAQAAHSVEECVFRLYDVWAPARAVAGLLSNDLAKGFALANALLVLIGAWCYAASVRHARPSARRVAWCWALLELGNGAVHTLVAIGRAEFFPGVATAPFLLAISFYLIARLRHE